MNVPENICGCGRCSTRWLMGPAMVLTTGILFMFHTLNIADLDRTWPAWILVVGIVKLLQSSASSVGHVGPLPGAPLPSRRPNPHPRQLPITALPIKAQLLLPGRHAMSSPIQTPPRSISTCSAPSSAPPPLSPDRLS